MTIRKPIVQINGQLSELPATDLALNNVVPTTYAPSTFSNETSVSWVESVEGTGEGRLSLLSVSRIGTVYTEQVTLFATNAAGNKFYAHLQRVE